ncbi:phage tail protein [Lysinibacillus sp. 38-6]|uniref:phage tail protein n=1 Tax=Lysinibacillus sp. 38-6 TaxID=3385991 RepID=UPI003908AE24
MIYVTSLDGSQIEPLHDIVTDFNMEQSVDGTFTVSFSCFKGPNNPGYDVLESESIVTVDGYDFRVKQYSNTTHSKTVMAVSVFYDLTKVQQHAHFSGHHTLQNHLHFALNGTGWTVIIDDDIAQKTNYIRSLGKGNIVSLVKKICNYHEVEYILLPDKKIHFKKEIGGDYDYQYRYKHNISSVVLNEDTTNLATVIKGYGADGLTVEYRSPNIATFGRLEAEPVRDERFTNRETLLNYIKSQLQDVPELAIESTIPELVEREIGERIWLIYEPLLIEMQTRILQQTKVLRDGKLITQSVVFGNSLPKTAEDVMVDQKKELDDTNEELGEMKQELTTNMDETKKKFQSKFDKTDDRITLEVTQLNRSIGAIEVKADNISLAVNNRITKEIAAIEVKADDISLSVNNRITKEIAAIEIKADKISQTVNNRITNEVAAINVRANQIQSTVSAQAVQIQGIGTRVANAESSITQQAHQISQKVSVTDFNGNTISSLINQTATSVKIRAQNIELQGAVRVLSDISGNLGTIHAGYIRIKEDIHMGNRLHFSDLTSVGGANGTIQLSAWNDIVYSGSRHSFNGTVDFSGARVVGLGGGGNYVSTNTLGLEITQSSNNARTIVFKRFGRDLGTITLR